MEEKKETSLMDLPDPVLVSILSRLSPSSLCTVALVSQSLKQICYTDQIWELHINLKWGTLISHPGARRAWEFYTSMRNDLRSRGEGCFSFKDFLPFLRSEFSFGNQDIVKSVSDSCSMMKYYSALETGKFWLPAQVYNRENGKAGFELSCYDAELCYDRRTDTFGAWYAPDHRPMGWIEYGVEWDRVRAPPIDISCHDLYLSECLDELKPGDHFETQWRGNRAFSYGWWFGVVGHLQGCSEVPNHCCCHASDVLVAEFKHHPEDSVWRKMKLNRRGHFEEGDKTCGFYGGLRRLEMEEVATWMRFWPIERLE